MSQKISIICPNCRAKLSFMEVPGWKEKLVECPHCHFKSQANVYQMGFAAPKPGSTDDAFTQLASGFCPSRQSAVIGVIKVEETGRTHQLQMGTNVIGRVATTGTADLKISTDPYMSRRHLQIDVVDGPTGIEHRLVEIESKNIIILNGKPIQRKDVLVLKFGDKMVLGKTTVSLEAPTPDDEENTKLMNK